MNIKHIATSFVALTIIAGASNVALAGTTLSSDPIVINAVNVQPSGESDTVGSGFVYVEFQNSGSVNATQVIFELDVRGAKVGRFNDIGNFAPGIAIKHGFLNTSGDPNAQLNIVKVKLADGSVWVPPYVPSEDD
jgi:hypothetical protein